MEEVRINYLDWNGRERTHLLSASEGLVKNGKALCPLDNTQLIQSSGDGGDIIYCPNCNRVYHSCSEEDLEKEKLELVSSAEEELEHIKERGKDLGKMLRISEVGFSEYIAGIRRAEHGVFS